MIERGEFGKTKIGFHCDSCKTGYIETRSRYLEAAIDEATAEKWTIRFDKVDHGWVHLCPDCETT